MNAFQIRTRILAAIAISSLALAACGTEEEEIPNDDAATEVDAGGDASGDTVSTPDGCTADSCGNPPDAEIIVDVGGSIDILPRCTEPDPRGCLAIGCEPGFECIPSDTDACVPSVCTCDTDADEWTCTADCGQAHVCAPEESPACETPNPSVTCMDVGCEDGFDCVQEDADACLPSFCSCDEVSGEWGCSEDCNPSYACEPGDDICPANEPFGESCGDLPDGTECGWGMEACCGEVYNSTECTCSGGGWACHATDACFMESCAGRSCESDTDCFGGGAQTVCFEGVCERADVCSGILFREGCNDVSLCQWQSAGCSDSGIEEGCYPLDTCSGDFGCPDGFTCNENVQVLPQCAYPADDGSSCDACSMERNLCIPDASE
jgi:hypothetical protein